MKPTVEYIEKKFDEFNEKYFDSKLERVPIELWKSKHSLGQCMYRVRRTILGKKHYYDFKIRINERLDMSEDELDDVIIHEMIHLRIFSKPYYDRSAHGPIFRKMMNHINERYGRHIRIRYKFSEVGDNQLYDNRSRPRIILELELNDGHHGIKVLTNNGATVADYLEDLGTLSNVLTKHLYLSYDPYFNRFPTSSSFRYNRISKEELVLHFEDATNIDNLKWEGRLTKRKYNLLNKGTN